MHARCCKSYQSIPNDVLRRGLALPGAVICLLLSSLPHPARSQVVLRPTPVTTVAIEGYGNLTTGALSQGRLRDNRALESVEFDAAGRVLARFANPIGPDVGLRIVADVFNDHARISEASLLLFGAGGRLEIGKRMGLPDVLTGYAPNTFAFTTAQFGPPTGLTLDPGGGLITHYLRANLRSSLEPLAARGVTASLFNDESTKILYVLPKRNGWEAGLSVARNAQDTRFDRLVQFGLVHETYWSQNVWRWGGTYAHARAEPVAGRESLRDLNSIGIGTSLVLDDSLEIGVAASYDGESGNPVASSSTPTSTGWGSTFSVNYNSGPWTIGGYYQYARAPAADRVFGNGRLSAVELGMSYRFTTRARIYGGWLLYDLKNDRGNDESAAGSGSLFVVGLRAQL